MTVDVKQLESSRLQPVQEVRREPAHQLIAQLVVGFALAPQARAVERDQLAGLDRASVELPAVWRE
jgi:hypothetical protein